MGCRLLGSGKQKTQTSKKLKFILKGDKTIVGATANQNFTAANLKVRTAMALTFFYLILYEILHAKNVDFLDKIKI
jgi:hypothetical protein